jgi:hypothetical protein
MDALCSSAFSSVDPVIITLHRGVLYGNVRWMSDSYILPDNKYTNQYKYLKYISIYLLFKIILYYIWLSSYHIIHTHLYIDCYILSVLVQIL